MAHTSASATHPHATPGAIAFNVTLLGLLAALIGVGFAYFLDFTSATAPKPPALNSDGPVIEKSIAGRRLAIPAPWFRFADQQSPGFSEKIDLIFALPLGAEGRTVQVEVSLMPRSRVRPSDRLLDSVYLHQFETGQLDGPIGLIGKPLKPLEGFQNETVWYDPLSPEPFVAKCTPEISAPETARCMRTVLVDDQVAATYVFDAEILSAWKSFDAEAGRWLSRIGGI